MEMEEDLTIGGPAEQGRIPLERHGAVGGADHRHDDPRTTVRSRPVGQVVGLGHRDLGRNGMDQSHLSCLAGAPARLLVDGPATKVTRPGEKPPAPFLMTRQMVL